MGTVYDYLNSDRPLLRGDSNHEKWAVWREGSLGGHFGAPTPVADPAQGSLVSVPGRLERSPSASYT